MNKLYTLEFTADKLKIDDSVFTSVKLVGYVQRKNLLILNWEHYFSAESYDYFLQQQKEGYVSEEYLYIQELFTLDDVELVKPHLQKLGTGQFNKVSLPLSNNYPLSAIHESHYKETFSYEIKINDKLNVILYGYKQDLQH